MKRIDAKTRNKLYWLFTPLVVVGLILLTYIFSGVNILNRWFGMDIDILEWVKPALLGSASIIFIGFSIAAVRQKCWEEFAFGIIILLIMLLNMSNFFVNLLGG